MNRRFIFNFIVLTGMALGLVACSAPGKNYKDTSALEKPPQLEIATGNAEQLTPTGERRKDLTEQLTSIDDTHLLLKQPLGTAWKTLEAAIKESGLKLVDKNLEKGFYYVYYDPDTFKSKTEENWLDKVNAVLFADEVKKPENLYAISIRPKPESIVIHTMLMESATSSSDKTHPDASVQLLTVLYKALRTELSPAESTEHSHPDNNGENSGRSHRRR